MHRHHRLVLLGAIVLFAGRCSSPMPSAPSTIPSAGAPSPGVQVADIRSSSGVASQGKAEQLEGRIEGLPATPAGSLVVAGTTVLTDAQTSFVLGDGAATFADLVVGQRVHVNGQSTPDGLLARIVRIQNTQSDLPGNGNALPPPPTDPPPDPTPTPPAPDPAPAFDPEPIGTVALCQSFTCGFVFSPLQDVSVVALGQWDQNLDGLASTSAVTLWAIDGTPLASVSVPGGLSAPLTGEYRYVTLTTPVHLVAGQQYVVGSAFVSTGAPVFDASGMAPLFTAIEGRNILALAFPTRSDSRLFGGANFEFVPAAP